MRRTYRSKKETGDGLDRRDVVLAMDEKSSAFDAFYIQNIKQTKRDISVGASMFAASNKVRKRKYVKRLKDQEPIIRDTRESTSRSGYLTPDKSIHLKRELDPFDLLLNSSPINEINSQLVNNVFNPLHTRGKGKTYRKKAPCKKKFNYSSDSTDSGKENSHNCSKSKETQDVSNVLSHKLQIEKEAKNSSKDKDESIVNIITDLSLLKNIQNLTSVSPLSSTIKNKLSMSSIQKSPLCSTPFHKKYRGKSIYKFSPISVNINDSNYSFVTGKLEENVEKKDKANSVPNATTQFASYNKSEDNDKIGSPILSFPSVTDKNRTKGILKHHHPIAKELSLLQTSEQEPFLGFPLNNALSAKKINLQIDKNLEIKGKILKDLLQNQNLDFTNTTGENRYSIVDSKNNQYSTHKDDNNASSYPSTTLEHQSVVVKSLDSLKYDDVTDQYNEQKIRQEDVNTSQEEAISQTYLKKNNMMVHEYSLNNENTFGPMPIFCSENNNNIVENHILNEEKPSEPRQTYSENVKTSETVHSFDKENTLDSSQTYLEENSTIENDENTTEDIQQNSLEQNEIHSEKNSTFENEHSSLEISTSEGENEDNTWEPSQNNSNENSTVYGQHSSIDKSTSNNSINTESLYESCNSENEMSDIEKNNKELIVVIKRLNDSVFEKYYKKDTELTCNSSESDKRNDDSYSSEISSDSYTSLNENDTLLESEISKIDEDHDSGLKEGTDMYISNTDLNDNSSYENNKSDDEYFISFVTTRRKNEITRDPTKLSFENSLISTSSSEFDRTVLRSNKHSIDSLKVNNDITLTNNAQEKTNVEIADNSHIFNNKSLFQNETTVIESEITAPPKIKRFSVASKKSVGKSRSSKLSTENVPSNNRHSVDSLIGNDDITLTNDVQGNVSVKIADNSRIYNAKSLLQNESIIETELSPLQKIKRSSIASKKSVLKNRSSKLSTDNINKTAVTKENDLTSRNTAVSTKSSVPIRKSSKLSAHCMGGESHTEINDSKSRNSFLSTTNTARKSCRMDKESVPSKPENIAPPKCYNEPYHAKANDVSEIKQGIVLEPGKRWERSLSIYRRVTTMGDHFNQSMLDDEQLNNKGRKYRQSVINTMGMQDISVSLHNDSVKNRRSRLFTKPSRSTIKILRESNASRISLSSTSASEDLGFLSEDCDDTLVELSKLSIIDSEHEVTVLDKFNDTSNRITTARDYVLRRCNQTDVILFDECYPDTVLKNCRKIGEGVYGEVFLWRARDGRARVLKIVPIAGDTKVNGENQKDYHEVISEIVIAMELSALRAPIVDIEKHLDEGQGVETLDLHSVENATDVFNEVLAVRCVYGNYPSRLLDLWELYDETKGSENDNPAILPVDQQFMVLELANAGQDLESYQFHNAEQAYALFKQVAFGLAVAEEAFQFEHRDLHWGNVLIAPTDQKYATFVLRGRTHRVARRGVAATIIDYSLSRLSLRLPSADTAALYNDLGADDGLFDAVGDYQFEVYRLMRDKLGNDWKNYEPYTNILWLHYTVDKMITALRYTRTNTKIHKHYIAKLKEIKNRILDYGSAVQYVLTDSEL